MREVFVQHLLVRSTPLRRVGRQYSERKEQWTRVQPAIQRPTTVKTAFRVTVVEVVDDACYLDALVLVQRVLEHRECIAVRIPHHVLADDAAGVCETVGEPRR